MPASTAPHGPQPPPTASFDAVVLGSGASGMSLAYHLAVAGWGDRVLLVDEGSRPADDHAWAYWSTGRHLLDGIASEGSAALWVRGPGWQRRLDIHPYRYRRVTGRDLSSAVDRAWADRARADGGGLRRLRGRATSVVDRGGHVQVRIALPGTRRSVTARARWVFDSTAAPAAPGAEAAARLDFVGLHVEFDAPVFDVSAPTLMDFRTDQDAGLSFVYVLPSSDRSALVERTRFVVPGHHPTPPADHEAGVERYIRAHVSTSGHRVVGREVGTIPLCTAAPPTPRGRVIPIGASAGMVRASTGYGYERIQRHSAQLAHSLARHDHPYAARRPGRRHRLLDAALLAVVREEPEGVLEAFTRLFAGNPPARVLAFLDADTTLTDEVRLFLTLPKGPFWRALLRAGRRRQRPPASPTPTSVTELVR